MSTSTPPPGRTRDYAPAARRIVALSIAWLAAYAVGHWVWRLPALAYPRALAALSAEAAPTRLPVPVEGVRARRIADTFGAPRGRDRRHQGVDIFAPRGTSVRSATHGFVVAVRDGGLGGRQAWVLGPAGERHYYAHLDDWAPGLRAGDRVREGTPLGVVGDTGNARGTPPHLHYGIYTQAGAIDPLPRLRAFDAPSPPVNARDASSTRRRAAARNG